VFFFEKKNQKTFAIDRQHTACALNGTPDASSKSFLVLFFKKEQFLPFRIKKGPLGCRK
jgi:hypothetical protein